MPELEHSQPQQDPIASLHRMSTTAGIATQEYVAINNLSVVAAVLGAATALSFIALPFLLLGVAGVVLGILAIRQIRNSNGTQSGKGLAVLGIALSLLLAGAVAASAVLAKMSRRPDEEAINALIHDLGQRIIAKDYQGAYALFDEEFANQVPFAKFHQRWLSVQDSFGALQVLEGNNEFGDFTAGADVITVETMARIRLAQYTSDARILLYFSKRADGKWRVVRFGDWFTERPARGPGQ